MIPMILSGGSGTRLWPVSRESYPKQFCEFYDQSFLKNSITRVQRLGDPYIVTVETMKSLTWKLAQSVGLKQENMIYEPMPKNTAAAVAVFCHVLKLRGLENEIAGVFPADHLITDVNAFVQAVGLAEQVAKTGTVVTLGIVPRTPETGYGYIEVEDDVVATSGDVEAKAVKGFREKPNFETAKKFMNSGRHYWNAGLFVFRVKSMIENFEKYMPELWRKISAIKPDFSNAKYSYATLEAVSLDYGIMEKLENQVCIPCDLGWSDVGSWDEIARLAEEFPQLRSDSQTLVFSESASNNYTYSIRNKVIGLAGVDNLIVVDTPDALLIAKKGSSQKVKEIAQQIKTAGLTEATDHTFEVRPWGGFEVLSEQKDFKVKRVTVDPEQRLSYQSHARRAEHWLIIQGQARITLEDKNFDLKVGESFQIPKGSKHRIANPGTTPLIFVEVQTGEYLGEDDIVRYQDDYHR